MKTLASLLVLAALPALARGDEAWRWKDHTGTTCYSNRAEAVPPDAVPVKTRLIIEATRLPGAEPELVAHARPPRTLIRHKRMRRIYSEERLRFGCYAASIVYSGGWGHPDDINIVGNCLPYLLGPDAWLNAARAELALREHGLDWREVARMYAAQRKFERELGLRTAAPEESPLRLADVRDTD